MSPDLPLAAATHPVRFLLSADCSPGLLPRLLEPFARRDLIPDQVSARRNGSAVEVEIAVAAMPGEMLPYVEGNLRQVIGLRGLRRETAGLVMAAAA